MTPTFLLLVDSNQTLDKVLEGQNGESLCGEIDYF